MLTDESMLSRYRNCLVALFQRVHELPADPVEKRLLALAIQEELLTRITRTERLIRQTRAANKLIKIQLSQKGTHQRDTARQAKAKHEAGETKIQTYKVLISTLRSVGDAVAFIYGDRWDLRKLAAKEDAGFITEKRGTRLERSILRGAFRSGATVVMNDLTHTLRHGDITVFHPDLWPDGGSKFLLMEAKSGRGGNQDRAERQATAAKQILEYLSTDTHTG